MHILFVNPPNQLFEDVARHETGNDRPGPPLGVLYLSAIVKQKHSTITTELVDLQLQLVENVDRYPSLESFLDKEFGSKTQEQVDVVAISLSFNTNGESYAYLTKLAKQKWPQCKTIVGGPIVSGDPELFRTDSNLDFFCMGEGEISFCEWIASVQDSHQQEVQGIYPRASLQNNNENQNPFKSSPQVQNLNDLPFPDYDLIQDSFHKYQYGILTSRGCPNRCAYCSHSLISGKRMRFRSTALVLQEISFLKNVCGASYLAVFDSNVGLNKKEFFALLDGVQQISPDLELSFNPEITHLSVETLVAFRQHGLKRLVVSIESGSKYVLTQIMLRRNYLSKARELVQCARDLGMDVRCLFVLGMHGETEEMRLDTLEYAKSLAANWCTFYIATPVPGSKFYNDLKSQHLINANTPLELAQIKFRNRTFDLPGMSAEDTVEFQDEFEGRVNFLESYNVRVGDFDSALQNFIALADRFPHRMRAQFMILSIYHTLWELTSKEEWVEKFNQRQTLVQSLLDGNTLAQVEFQRYSQNPSYATLFSLLHIHLVPKLSGAVA